MIQCGYHSFWGFEFNTGGKGGGVQYDLLFLPLLNWVDIYLWLLMLLLRILYSEIDFVVTPHWFVGARYTLFHPFTFHFSVTLKIVS